MLHALGALASVLDVLQSSTTSKSPSPQTTGFSQPSTSPFDLTGSAAASGNPTPAPCYGGCSQISPATLSALLAAQSQSTTASTASAPTSRADALKDLFSQLDANGDGKISKSEFESALGAGGTNLAQADDVFKKLDKNGDGSVSFGELSSALKGAGGRGHHHRVADSDGASVAKGAGNSTGTSGSNSDSLLQALNGASSTLVTNSDGTTTTSVTYADGSKVTLTSPPVTSSTSAATSSYNFIEQLIQREAQAISSRAPAAFSLNV
jgi:Ca2+-binding EF-hand superfamily protein